MDNDGCLVEEWPLLDEFGYSLLMPDSIEEMALCPHDARSWKTAFREAGDGTSRPDMDRIRGLRRLIWIQTKNAIERCLEGKSPQPYTPLIYLGRNVTETFSKTLIELPPAAMEGEEKTSIKGGPRVEVVEADMLAEAEKFTSQGLKVAVLNMACQVKPGGGVYSGAGAQEENLHRRSDAFRFTMQHQRDKYPIPHDACLLSEGVTVFRSTEQDGYSFLDSPFQVSMISCAAIEHPALKEDNGSFVYDSPGVQQLMELKANLILSAAMHSGCDVAILSAFGCGAFCNPPEAVSEIFRRTIAKCPLKHISFCIINDHNSGCAHNPRGNYAPFVECFGGETITTTSL